MKSKNIPADIRKKSIKEAQNEIKNIIYELEKEETDLENSINQYNRMIQLNNHIHDKFKLQSKEINKKKINQKNKKNKK